MPEGRDRKGKKSRLELYLWVVVISIGFINLNLFRLSWNEEGNGLVKGGPIGGSVAVSKSAALKNLTTSRWDSKTSKHSIEEKGPLLQNLRDAGITDVSLFAKKLPTWKQVVDRFGDHPRIHGLDQCEKYREQVPMKDRMLGVAGTFNSGTNLMAQLMMANCRLPGRQHGMLGKSSGLLWQVNWGKHQPPRYRLQHKVKGIIDNEKILPMVMIRDPYSWLQSMCKRRYSAHWFHVVPKPDSTASVHPLNYHCPNFIPTEIERTWFNKPKNFIRQYYGGDPWMVDNVLDKANYTLESTVIPVRVRYKVTNEFHDSLVHMWKDWYEEYFNATFPRLILRLEDLVYHPKNVMKEVCECVGGSLAPNLTLLVDSAKKGSENVHGKIKTGLLDAMYSHVHGNKTAGMTIDDVVFANAVLNDSPLASTFGYRLPTT